MKTLILANNDVGLYKFRKEFMETLVEENEVYTCLPNGDIISGEVVSIFTKKKLRMRAGETDKAVSFKDAKLFALIGKFAEEAGFCGQIDIDMFDVNGEYFISEVNPRFGGGYPHAYECGCDHMTLIRNNLAGVVNKKNIGVYDDGVYMMKYSELILKV